MILALFLIGIAVGATSSTSSAARIREPILFLALAQFAVAILAMAGSILVIAQPRALDPGSRSMTLGALFGSAILVVLPARS